MVAQLPYTIFYFVLFMLFFCVTHCLITNNFIEKCFCVMHLTKKSVHANLEEFKILYCKVNFQKI